MSLLISYGPQPDAVLRLAIQRVDTPNVESYNLGQPQLGSESKGVDQVVPGIAARGAKNHPLLSLSQGLRTEVGHRGHLSTSIHAWVGVEVKAVPSKYPPLVFAPLRPEPRV